MLEDKVQDGGMLLFKFPYASNAMGQRSEDGEFSGRRVLLKELQFLVQEVGQSGGTEG